MEKVQDSNEVAFRPRAQHHWPDSGARRVRVVDGVPTVSYDSMDR